MMTFQRMNQYAVDPDPDIPAGSRDLSGWQPAGDQMFLNVRTAYDLRAEFPGDSQGVAVMVGRSMSDADQVRPFKVSHPNGSARTAVQKGIDKDMLAFLSDDLVTSHSQKT